MGRAILGARPADQGCTLANIYGALAAEQARRSDSGDRLRLVIETYGAEGEHSSKVQQRRRGTSTLATP